MAAANPKKQPTVVAARRVAAPAPPPEPVKRLQVLTRPDPAPAPAAPPRAMAPMPADRSPRSLAGAGALALGGVAFVVLLFTLPYLVETGPAGGTLDRDEVDDIFIDDYGQGLLERPVVSGVVIALMGALLVAWEIIAVGRTARLAGRFALHGVAAVAAFFLALVGTRWLGFYIVVLWNEGDTPLHLHAAPYMILAAGFAALSYTAWQSRAALLELRAPDDRGTLGPMPRRLAAIALGVALATLLALPLLPLASLDTGRQDLYLGESALSERSPGNVQPGHVDTDLFWARMMLWTVAVVSLASCLAAVLEREGRDPQLWGTLTHGFALNGIPVLVGLVFTILFYVHVHGEVTFGFGTGGLGIDSSASYNHFLALGFLALAAAYGYYVLRVLMPFLRVRSTPAYPSLAQVRPPA